MNEKSSSSGPYYVCTKCGAYRASSANSVRGMELCDCGYVMVERVPPPAACPPLVREALEDARSALASLPEDCLGEGQEAVSSPDGEAGAMRWPLRDELIAKITKALEAIP